MIGGYDIYIYSELYEMSLNQLNEIIIFEPGFVLYYKLLKLFSDDRAFMIFISSLVVLGLYMYILKKLSLWFYFSLFIFFCKFFLMSFVYIRQGVAMVVCLLGLYYLIKQKRLYAIVIIISSIFFHKSAIIFLPFVFVANFKFSYLQILFLGTIIMVFGSSFLGAVLVDSIGNAIENEKLIKYASKSGTINIFYAIEGLLVLILSFSFRNRFYHTKENVIIFNGILFYGFIILFSVANATFVRLSWYYFIFVCLGLPIIFIKIRNIKLRSLFYNLVFVYYALLFFRLLVLYDGGDFTPYKSIFQDFERNGRWEDREYRS